MNGTVILDQNVKLAPQPVWSEFEPAQRGTVPNASPFGGQEGQSHMMKVGTIRGTLTGGYSVAHDRAGMREP